MSPHLSPDAKAIVRAAEALTEQVRRIADRLATGARQDSHTLAPPATTERSGEAAIERVRGLATRLECFAENALKTDDRELYAAIARDLRTQLEGPATEPRLLGCGLCYEENGEECHPHPECPIGSPTSPLRDQIDKALHDHLARTADIRPTQSGEMAFMPEVTDAERLRMADAVLAVILPTTKLLGELARSADADLKRVTALYERWVQAGPPPLGTSVARWWDARLAELHAAILPPDQTETPAADQPKEQ
ncbi:hypothetical protein [Streptomyces spinosisporus]|uniref:Uncharacterized protein n=1 Tax=Streptomyces spinosisporus TaxID=2927582 RepID=A0ABS9XFX9_9ACTN|nr:hypothetical protein [Streptomyces spinosisporus]MCI3240261.1 hypothetical protein [Streptomyces spinosisporus]